MFIVLNYLVIQALRGCIERIKNIHYTIIKIYEVEKRDEIIRSTIINESCKH